MDILGRIAELEAELGELRAAAKRNVRKGRPSAVVQPTAELTEVFHRLVQRNQSTGCWNWLGFISGVNVPCLQVGPGRNGRNLISAVKYSYVLHFGDLPATPGRRVYRQCGNPACVAPSHLSGISTLRGRGTLKRRPSARANTTPQFPGIEAYYESYREPA